MIGYVITWLPIQAVSLQENENQIEFHSGFELGFLTHKKQIDNIYEESMEKFSILQIKWAINIILIYPKLFNSLVPGRHNCNFRYVVFEYMEVTDNLSISHLKLLSS